MTVTEKVAYLKGLAQGLGLEADNRQDKLIAAIIDVLDDMALSIADLEAGLDELGEQVDDIDEDLAAVEEDLYEDEDGCGCEHDGCDCCADDFIEVQCPQCGETICLDPDTLDHEDSIVCPNCKTDLEFDFGDDEQEAEEES